MKILKSIQAIFQSNKSNTLLEVIHFWSKKTPEEIAFEAPNRIALTYGLLYSLVQNVRKSFFQVGITSKDKVGLWLHTSPEYAVASIALAEDAICVPFSAQTPLLEAEGYFKNVNLDVLVTDESENSSLVKLAFTLNIKVVRIAVEDQKPTGSFSVLTKSGIPQKNYGKTNSGKTAFIFQTTGSTAKPKVVPISMEAIVLAARAMCDTLQINKNDTCLNFLPMNFIHGLVTSVYVPLMGGSTIVFPGLFERAKFTSWIKEHKPTWFSASPAIYSDILKLSQEELKEALRENSLRFIRVGSAPITKILTNTIEALFHVPLLEAYGMTETLVISCNPLKKRKVGSVGKLMPTMNLQILNTEGKRCKPFDRGTIWVKGKTVTKGYINNDEANAEAYKNNWFATGDIGYLDNEAFLYLEGRTKDMINKGGQKISPKEIEEILLSYDGVLDVIVFPIPHDVLGQNIAAAIILKPEYKYHENDIKRHLNALVSAFKIPQKIIFLEEFPRSENGKVLRLKFPQIFMDYMETNSTQIESVIMTEEQEYVHKHFTNILKKEFIAVDEDFFSLGGTSLDIAALMSLLEKELGDSIYGASLIENSTIKDFANYIKNNHGSSLQHFIEGCSDKHEHFTRLKIPNEYSARILGHQRKLFQLWTGKRLEAESLVAGKNTEGFKRPLFWCFQSHDEFNILAEELGSSQPLFGMRSGHLLFKMAEVESTGIARQYASEIMNIDSEGPYIIGGNCQGGMVAWYVAQELLSRGKQVELLFLMEVNIKKQYDSPITLIYGGESKEYNPYLYELNPENDWNKYYKSYSVTILKGEHGQYFHRENIKNLAFEISKRIEANGH